MYLSTARHRKGVSTNGLATYSRHRKAANLKEIIESLSNALLTLELLNEAELVQLLKMHVQNFPKEGLDFYKVTKRYEITLIEHALKQTGGSQTKAAKLLNLRLTTLNAMIKRYKIKI